MKVVGVSYTKSWPASELAASLSCDAITACVGWNKDGISSFGFVWQAEAVHGTAGAGGGGRHPAPAGDPAARGRSGGIGAGRAGRFCCCRGDGRCSPAAAPRAGPLPCSAAQAMKSRLTRCRDLWTCLHRAVGTSHCTVALREQSGFTTKIRIRKGILTCQHSEAGLREREKERERCMTLASN